MTAISLKSPILGKRKFTEFNLFLNHCRVPSFVKLVRFEKSQVKNFELNIQHKDTGKNPLKIV